MKNMIASCSLELSWSKLPFWTGVKPNLTQPSYYSLSLSTHSDGYIFQCGTGADEAIINYESLDYNFITAPPGTTDWGTKLGNEKIHTLEKYITDITGKRVLEIGGGNLFLGSNLCNKYKISEYVAVDPTLKNWPDNSFIKTVRDYFPSSDLKGEKFDLIIAFNCLEHIPDSVNFLRAVSDLLLPDGKAFITFPDVSRQFAVGDLGAILHEHVNYYDESIIRQIALLSGLSVVNYEIRNDLAFCLLYKASSKPHLPTEKLRDSTCLASKLLTKATNGFCVLLQEKLDDLLINIASGKNIAFYGATNGLNNLLYLINHDINQSLNLNKIPIYDSDKSKLGCYIPMSTNPIRHFNESNDLNEFDAIYITAGSFYNEIHVSLSSAGVEHGKIKKIFNN